MSRINAWSLRVLGVGTVIVSAVGFEIAGFLASTIAIAAGLMLYWAGSKRSGVSPRSARGFLSLVLWMVLLLIALGVAGGAG